MTCATCCDLTPVAPVDVAFTCTFRGVDDAIEDPTGVIVTWRAPDGETTVFVYGVDAEVVKVDDGIYNCAFVLETPGLWLVKFEGEGVATVTGSITVLDAGF